MTCHCQAFRCIAKLSFCHLLDRLDPARPDGVEIIERNRYKPSLSNTHKLINRYKKVDLPQQVRELTIRQKRKRGRRKERKQQVDSSSDRINPKLQKFRQTRKKQNHHLPFHQIFCPSNKYQRKPNTSRITKESDRNYKRRKVNRMMHLKVRSL